MSDQRFAHLPIPLSPDRWAWLAATWPLSAQEWDQLMTTLDAMRPGLVDDVAEGTATRNAIRRLRAALRAGQVTHDDIAGAIDRANSLIAAAPHDASAISLLRKCVAVHRRAID